ncbi:MAG: hypothetical protein U0R19_23885 [Bryobacteraceae bacterium]
MTQGYRSTHTPKALYDAYRTLTVELPDQQLLYFVDIREYRNYGLPKSEYSCLAGVEAFNKLHRAIAKDGKKAGPHRYNLTLLRRVAGPPPVDESLAGWGGGVAGEKLLVHTTDLMLPYIGKGAPDEIQLALRLAVYYGLVKPTLGDLQAYCNEFIGLDCSGFTGVYYGPPYRGKSSVAYRTLGKEVKELADIEQGCAIVFLKTNHISVIDSVYRDYVVNGKKVAVECMVAEATAAKMEMEDPNDGLNYSSYTILKKPKGWDVTRRIIKGEELKDTNPTVTIRKLT